MRLGSLVGDDDVEEEFVDARVARQLRMEGGSEEVALADENRCSIACRQSLDARAGAGDAWGADEDHLDRVAGDGSRFDDDGRVNLTSVGVALHGDVKGREGGLRGVQDFVGQQDDPGTGAEGRRRADEVVEDGEEAIAFEMLEEGCRLTAGDDEAVEAFQLVWTADEPGDRAERR